MDLNQVKSKLDKVNRYFEFLNSSKDSISQIDKDAMLAAIRDLYDVCINPAAVSPAMTVAVETVVEETPAPKKKPKLIFNDEEATKKVEKKEPKVEKEAPIVKKEEAPAEKVEVVPVQKEVKEEPKPKETPKVKEEPKQVDNTLVFDNEEIEDLFTFKAATDLSQKLSEAPITDLNKALGLNQKFLYINELFSGDVAEFQEYVKQLNSAGGFDGAQKIMLNNIIEPHGWLKNKERKQVAKDFVKLVRRRYL